MDADSNSQAETSARGTSTRQVEQLALLTLVILLAALGFVFSIAWIAAIVLLAVAWGYQASTLRASRADGGVVSALVTTAVHEARSIAADATAAVHDARAPDAIDKPSDGKPSDGDGGDGGDAEQTKEDLYKQAQDADIAGRSSMSKDELKQALNDSP
jgi:hypothetical protein